MPHAASAAAATVTVSVGVASLTPDDADAHELVTRATEALELAVQLGRDQVAGCATHTPQPRVPTDQGGVA